MYKAKILSNLKKFGCKWVNYFCVIDNLDIADSSASVAELIQEGRIEKQTVYLSDDKFGRPIYAPLYRLAPTSENFRSSTLTIVK